MAAVTPLRDPLLDGPLPRDAVRRAAPVAQRRPRPELLVVPRRRRRTASIMALGCMLLFAMLLGTVALQTRIAQNQLALDKTDRAVKVARERYDLLRRARAELRSPNRLAVEADRLGMAPTAKGEFMTISPATVAHLMATSGWLANNPAENSVSSLEQFGQVKAVAGDAP